MIDQQTLKSVEDLHRLKNEGVITAEEFDKAKEKLLFGPKAAASNPTIATATGKSLPPPTPAMEDLLGWITLPLKRYADFKGRSSRREFWLFQLALMGFAIVAMIMISSDLGVTGGSVLSALMLMTIGVATLGLIVPLIALQVRRFHDQNRSGWFALFNFLPYAGAIIVYAFMLIEGTKGENDFGPDPWQG